MKRKEGKMKTSCGNSISLYPLQFFVWNIKKINIQNWNFLKRAEKNCILDMRINLAGYRFFHSVFNWNCWIEFWVIERKTRWSNWLKSLLLVSTSWSFSYSPRFSVYSFSLHLSLYQPCYLILSSPSPRFIHSFP